MVQLVSTIIMVEEVAEAEVEKGVLGHLSNLMKHVKFATRLDIQQMTTVIVLKKVLFPNLLKIFLKKLRIRELLLLLLQMKGEMTKHDF